MNILQNIVAYGNTPSEFPVPNLLKKYPQFVCWKKVHKSGKKKFDKIPFNPKTGKPASTTDPSTWTDYETAYNAYINGGYAGIGFVFTENDPFVFLDLDDCAEEENWRGHALHACQALPNAAWETSQSGSGLHAIAQVKDKNQFKNCRKKFTDDNGNQYEFYTHGRFMAFGQCNWTRPDLLVLDEHQEQFLLDLVPLDYSQQQEPINWDQEPPDESEDEVIFSKFKNADKQKPEVLFGGSPSNIDLWNGKENLGLLYPASNDERPFDNSSAEQALANKLAYYSDGNAAQVERLMNKAPLCQREKWQNRKDYRERTINKAILNFRNHESKINAQTSSIVDSNHPSPIDPKPQKILASLHERFQRPKAFPWLIKNMIPHKSTGSLFAAPGDGKTFAAIKMAYCVASGIPFNEQKVKRGLVVYIAGEGHQGITQRFEALCEQNPDINIGNNVYISERALSFVGGDDVSTLISEIDELHQMPILIVIDTLFRATAGADVNDASAMTKFWESIDQLKNKYGATILVVHHSGRGDQSRSFGSIVLLANADFEISISDKDGIKTIKNTKAKDSEPFDDMFFKLKKVPLPSVIDEDGEMVVRSTCLVEFITPPNNHGKNKETAKNAGKFYPIGPTAKPQRAVGSLIARIHDEILKNQGISQSETACNQVRITQNIIKKYYSFYWGLKKDDVRNGINGLATPKVRNPKPWIEIHNDKTITPTSDLLKWGRTEDCDDYIDIMFELKDLEDCYCA